MLERAADKCTRGLELPGGVGCFIGVINGRSTNVSGSFERGNASVKKRTVCEGFAGGPAVWVVAGAGAASTYGLELDAAVML